ncbi:MAG: PorV/PorQ family protein [Ignavibacteriae bacterium]|nr:MAG: PorV/PorQ family protein [Ignavibacteriota bacterium]
MKKNNDIRMFFPRLLHLKIGTTKMRNSIVLCLGLLLLGYSTLCAQGGVTKVGTAAAKFLSIDVGPQATAMGSAYVSIANDVSAMYWNPAGVARMNNFEAAFSSTKWIADISFNYAGVVVPVGGFGTLGLNATFLTMDQIERTTTESPDGTGEFFDAGSYAFGLVYSRNLTDQFSIGVNVKYINERLYHSNADGFALDVGALFDTHFNGLKLGMCISNYGTKMQLDGQDFQVQHDVYPSVAGNNGNINSRLSTDPYDLPLLFRLGVSMDVLKGWANSNLTLSADALHPSDDAEYMNVGAEYVFENLIALRAGYKGLFAKDSEFCFHADGGIRYEIGGTTLKVDYSYISFGVLTSVHMFSVGLGL